MVAVIDTVTADTIRIYSILVLLIKNKKTDVLNEILVKINRDKMVK